MAGVQAVSFTNPYSAEEDDIARRRRMAEALQAQGSSGLGPTETVGGWAIPKSPWEGLGKVAQSASGAYQEKQADRQQKDLANRYQSDLSSALSRAQSATTGSPGGMEDTGGGDIVNQPARAPNRDAMIQALMSHPATQQMGFAQMTKDMDAADRSRKLADALKMTSGGAAGAAPAGGQGANIMAGMPPQIVALMTSGDAELVKLGTTLMEANKGIAQRPGAPVVNPFTGAVIAQPTPSVPAGVGLQVGPGGPAAYPVPGAIPAMAATAQSQTAASEAGKAPYQLQTVQTEGSPTLMTHEQAIQAATGRPMPQPGMQPVPQASGQQMGSVPAPRPGTPDYEAYSQVAAGKVPSAYVPQTPAPQAAPGLRLQDQGENAYQVERGRGYAKMADELRHSWTNSQNQKQMLDRLEGLFADPNVAKGALAENLSDLKNVAASFNVPIKGLQAEQAIQSLTNEFALQLRNPSGGAGMPGAMSDQDRKFLASIPPGMSKTPEGRAQIMDTMRKKLNRDQEVADMANRYELEHGKIDAGFEKQVRKFANDNPIFGKKPETVKISPATRAFLKSQGIEAD